MANYNLSKNHLAQAFNANEKLNEALDGEMEKKPDSSEADQVMAAYYMNNNTAAVDVVNRDKERAEEEADDILGRSRHE
ncbi:hypothetical protein N781_17255 [Pontibacillus halophilus JSM 076056 = DSM 19796]|uniref:Uncharacterized protein n=1 Tax=Pontibacillus halophilus JSM 076056 = DSM 19796 TaxID=1385510 RepID=A0A0A5GN18_9BACI|nr:hypothetical protein [Pontibacillus halophilus]KGX92530.1 hypothetical protein N781_17255 [Pontibacillus halophilus JSM 076056 = DSM 19796]